MEAKDRIARAYSRLRALRGAMEAEPATHQQFPEKYVLEFHGALDHLVELGFDMDEFRLPDEEVKPRVTGGNYLTGEADYSTERFVDRSLFFAKLDAVLTYFEIVTTPPEQPKPQIGFHGRPK